MNPNKKWKKSISVALLVALATLATTGLVLADHMNPVEGVAVSSLTYFNQYNAVIEHMEEDRVAAETALRTKVDTRSVERFEQYSRAIKLAEEEHDAAVIAASTRVDLGSYESFKQYSEAIEQAEKERNAVVAVSQTNANDDSKLRWKQYFTYAR